MENVAQCLMSMKGKQIFSSDHFPPATPSSNSSWEETAFAKDMRAGILRGCMWPPRFYSCTFCEREFKSAQALGGHMNVHRRDRARLKQHPNSPCSEANHRQVLDRRNKSLPSQPATNAGSLEHELLSTPNPSSGHSTTTSPNTFMSSNVKAFSTMERFKMSRCYSTIPREQYKKPCVNSQTDNDGLLELLLAPTLPKPREVKRDREETGVPVQTNLSIALNSCVDRSSTTPVIDEAIPHKRHRISFSSLPEFVMSSCFNAGYLRLQSPDVIIGVLPAGIDELDLELRLGNPQRGAVV